MPDASSQYTISNSPNNPTRRKSISRILRALCLLAVATTAVAQTAGTYTVSNLISDGSVPATIIDANFINPWGVTNGTFWINTQGTGLDYVVAATNFPPFTPPATPAVNFKIVIPAATGGTTATGSPTGAASTGAATGFVLPNGTKASFLFASLDGVITGWNNLLGTNGAVAQVAINSNAAGAVYTGLALATNTTGTFILAANFGKAATIEVYDNKFAAAKLAGTFTDPSLPAGYVPYNVHVIGTQVFVMYALRAATGGPTIAPGNGMVNIFDTSGNFVSRAVSPGGNLNAPWGVAIAPTTFGIFGGDLLVGNFGRRHHQRLRSEDLRLPGATSRRHWQDLCLRQPVGDLFRAHRALFGKRRQSQHTLLRCRPGRRETWPSRLYQHQRNNEWSSDLWLQCICVCGHGRSRIVRHSCSQRRAYEQLQRHRHAYVHQSSRSCHMHLLARDVGGDFWSARHHHPHHQNGKENCASPTIHSSRSRHRWNHRRSACSFRCLPYILPSPAFGQTTLHPASRSTGSPSGLRRLYRGLFEQQRRLRPIHSAWHSSNHGPSQVGHSHANHGHQPDGAVAPQNV